MTEKQLTAWLKSLPREQSQEQVDQREHRRDKARGEWVANQVVHHNYGESRR